jgi:flagellar basal body-associated protein FliL
MRIIALFLVLLFCGLFLYGFFTYREILLRMKEDEKAIAAREKEIILLYRSKLRELEEDYASLVKKGDRMTTGDKKKLAKLAEKIERMKEIVGEWERAQEAERKNTLYRMCVEIYSQTKGVCEYLKEKSGE